VLLIVIQLTDGGPGTHLYGSKILLGYRAEFKETTLGLEEEQPRGRGGARS